MAAYAGTIFLDTGIIVTNPQAVYQAQAIIVSYTVPGAHPAGAYAGDVRVDAKVVFIQPTYWNPAPGGIVARIGLSITFEMDLPGVQFAPTITAYAYTVKEIQ